MARKDSRDSPSPFEPRNRIVREKSICSNADAESLQDEFDEQRRRHDENSFFAGTQKQQKYAKTIIRKRTKVEHIDNGVFK
jgi:hypothetical protein